MAEGSELTRPIGTLNNFANLYLAQNDFNLAELTYLRVLKILRENANANPSIYLPLLATNLNNLGVVYKQQNNPSKAESAYLESLKIRQNLSTVEPAVYVPDVAMSLSNLRFCIGKQTT